MRSRFLAEELHLSIKVLVGLSRAWLATQVADCPDDPLDPAEVVAQHMAPCPEPCLWRLGVPGDDIQMLAGMKIVDATGVPVPDCPGTASCPVRRPRAPRADMRTPAAVGRMRPHARARLSAWTFPLRACGQDTVFSPDCPAHHGRTGCRRDASPQDPSVRPSSPFISGTITPSSDTDML